MEWHEEKTSISLFNALHKESEKGAVKEHSDKVVNTLPHTPTL